MCALNGSEMRLRSGTRGSAPNLAAWGSLQRSPTSLPGGKGAHCPSPRKNLTPALGLRPRSSASSCGLGSVCCGPSGLASSPSPVATTKLTKLKKLKLKKTGECSTQNTSRGNKFFLSLSVQHSPVFSFKLIGFLFSV